MKIIDKIYHAKQAPRNKNVLWIDGEKKMYVYGNKWENLGNSGNSGGFTPEEVIKASQSYPYNVPTLQGAKELYNFDFKSEAFEGDLMISYSIYGATDLRLFAEGSFLANHVKKVNIMGKDVEDMASLPDIITMINATYSAQGFFVDVKFTLDTDTIEGDLFGIDYTHGIINKPFPYKISVNCKVKSLDLSNVMTVLRVSMLNSPTETLEQGSIIKCNCFQFVLPLALKNLEENAFANNCDAKALFMPSLTVPESLSQSLSLTPLGDAPMLYFPALVGERTYKDYVADVFNIDVTTEAGAAKVYCFDVATGERVTFKQQS